MTAETNLKLFEIVTRNFKNQEDARLFVTEIDKLISEKQNEQAKQLSTKEDLSNTKSALKEDLSNVRLALKDDINASKLDLMKWMFGFWVTIVLLILANWFLKR